MSESKLRSIAGNHAIKEILSVRPRTVRAAWLTQRWESSADLREFHKILTANKIKVEIKPDNKLEEICRSHQGAILQADPQKEFDLAQLKEATTATVLLLDGLEDPHNLGAILRTSWLLGVKAILVPQDRAVGLTATVHKIACGGVEHVPVITCNQFAKPIEELKEMGFWVFGLSHKAKTTLHSWKAHEKVVWCIGAEEKGLRTTTERLCDELVQIPQLSAAASFNASVAAAIALSETHRQHSSL